LVIFFLAKPLNLTFGGFALTVALLDNVDMKIDRHIPVPPEADARQRYPFPDMKIGDSFLVLEADWIKNLRSAAYMYAKRHPGVRFTIRKYGEGWRLWRVA
jgi:hypothetical protein